MKNTGTTHTVATPRPTFMEHRWGQRLPCRARVSISTGANFAGLGSVRDISSSGAFIETAAALPVNAPIILTVLGNESTMRAVEITAIVVRAVRDGVGVEWCETPVGSICAKVGCTTRCTALHPAARPS